MSEASAATLGTIWVDAQLPPSLAQWLATEHQEYAVHVADLDFLSAN